MEVTGKTLKPWSSRPGLIPAGVARRRRLERDFIAGALCAVVMVAYAGSCANLIFSGMPAQFGAEGMLAALVSCVVTVLVLSRWSSFELSLGGPDSNPSAILAVTVTAIAAKITAESGAGAAALAPTVFMFVSVSAFGCGLVLVLIGERRLGRCVRFIPHPVIGGFLGGTGYLLLSGGYKMLTGFAPDGGFGAHLATVPPLAWGTALGTAAVLTVLMRCWRHYLVIPGVLAAAIFGFYALLAAAGRSVAEARGLGLLMKPLRLGAWTNAAHFPYAQVRWDLLLLHWNDFAVMTVVVIITSLLNATGIDVATGVEVKIDRELQALGMANIVNGLAGGVVAVNSFNRTVLNKKAGASSPWAGRFCAGFILLLILADPGLIGLIPRPVLTGLIIYLGLSLLITWLWDARRTMPVSDRLIVAAIVIAVAVAGVVPGVLFGVIIACLNFVFAFSRNPAVKYSFTAANRRSNVERTSGELRCLTEHREVLRGFVLQGFLFFGTANSVLDEVRKVLVQARWLLLDFQLVGGIDSSSAIALGKIRTLSAEKGIRLVITGVSPGLMVRLRRAGFDLSDPLLSVFPDLDHGLEWCENAIIAAGPPDSDGPEFGAILRQFQAGPMAAYLVSVAVRAGEAVLRQGEPSDALYVVASGQVSVHLRSDPSPGGSGLVRRLRTYGPGTVVGEMGFYTGEPRSADIVADVDAILLKLSRERMQALERENPGEAQQFHRHVVRALALRLRAANEEIRLLH